MPPRVDCCSLMMLMMFFFQGFVSGITGIVTKPIKGTLN